MLYLWTIVQMPDDLPFASHDLLEKPMMKYFSKLMTPDYRRITLGLLVSGALFIIAAMIIGIADNVPGLIVLFIGVILFMFAFVHIWRKEKSFLILLAVSFVGGIVFAILHNLFDAFAVQLSGYTVLAAGMEVLSVIAFFIAILICPVGMMIGFFGAILTYFLKKNPNKAADE